MVGGAYGQGNTRDRRRAESTERLLEEIAKLRKDLNLATKKQEDDMLWIVSELDKLKEVKR